MKYELPKNWKFSNLNELMDFVIGGDWGIDPDEPSNDKYINVLCIRGGELKNWKKDKGNKATLRKVKIESLEKRELKEGDILLEISGGGPDQPVGRSVIIDSDVLNFQPSMPKITTNFMRQIRINSKVDSFYINHYLQYFYNTGEVEKYQGGSNNLRNLKFQEYAKIDIPIAPLNEQKRIVRKLEAINNHFENIKRKLDTLPLSIKQFRQSVLHQAISGKLTKSWRSNNETISLKKHDAFMSDVSISEDNANKNWIKGSIANLYYLNPGHKGLEIDLDTEVSFIPMASIYEETGIVDLSITKKYMEVKNGFTKFIEGDVIFAKITPCMENGKAAIARGLKNGIACGTTELHVFREKIKKTNKFLYYFLSQESLRVLAKENFHGTSGHLRVPTSFFQELEISLPPLEEQKEIERMVEKMFAVADSIEKVYEQLKKGIDGLPQASLSKAFKGELVSENKNDESVSKLLNQIKEDIEYKKSKKKA